MTKFQPWLFKPYWFSPRQREKENDVMTDSGQSNGQEKELSTCEGGEKRKSSNMAVEKKINPVEVIGNVENLKGIHESVVCGNEQLDKGDCKSERTPASFAGKSWAELFAEAVKLHQYGIAGNKDAVKEAYELLKKIRGMDPNNNLVEAYYGSATALLGRDLVDPMERFKKAVKGLKILDRTVSNDPENTEIRILRAYVSYRLPEMYFHRTATAVEDFSYLVSRYEQDPSVFSEEFYWQILFDLGFANKTLGQNQEAESVWLKLLSITGDTKYKGLLKQHGIKTIQDQEPEQVTDLTGPYKTESTFEPEAKLLSQKKEKLLQEGIKLHALALSGDQEATKKAFEFFTDALEIDHDDQLIKAYHADCMSMTGRDGADVAEMFTSAIKAMKVFDSAVNTDPDNIKIRFLRANHSYRLPEAFFRRTVTAITDFEYLIQRYENEPTIISEESYQQILHDLGVAYQRLGLEEEAFAAWEKLLSLDPNSKYKPIIEKQRGYDLPGSPFEHLSLDHREAYVEEGHQLHELGVAGNKAAVKKALDLWEKAYEADPKDTVAQAYYGSCLALSGRDSTDPNIIFSNTIKGLKLLNRAISRNWKNPKIRLLRAYLAYSLPESFFHLTERAIKDFRQLKMAYEQDNNVFSRELYHQILYDLGIAYQRTGNNPKAKKVWSKLLKESEDPKYKALLHGKVENQG